LYTPSWRWNYEFCWFWLLPLEGGHLNSIALGLPSLMCWFRKCFSGFSSLKCVRVYFPNGLGFSSLNGGQGFLPCPRRERKRFRVFFPKRDQGSLPWSTCTRGIAIEMENSWGSGFSSLDRIWLGCSLKMFHQGSLPWFKTFFSQGFASLGFCDFIRV